MDEIRIDPMRQSRVPSQLHTFLLFFSCFSLHSKQVSLFIPNGVHTAGGMQMNQSHLLDHDDWELLLPDEQINDDDDDDERVSNRIMIYSSTIFNFQADYFICPQFADNNNSVGVTILSPPPPRDDDSVSQVFFNNQQSEEMLIRVESPKSKGVNMGSVVDPDQIEFRSPFHLDIMGYDDYEKQSSSPGGGWDFNFNIWKWSVSAISSLGVATAALCILIFSSNNNRDLPHSQKLHSSYPQGKNRGVHQASMIMAVRGGARVTRARIICGGCYKGAV